MTLRLEGVRWDGFFPPRPDTRDLAQYAGLHRGRCILVTGAGGSIGAALARTILRFEPCTLVLLDSSEQNLYDIDRELSQIPRSTTLVSILGSVADQICIDDLLAQFRPRIVYHAAALKHVPLGEKNPFAVVHNNIFGTVTVANAAREHSVDRLIMISTSKSVNPESIMGASKRLAELYLYGMTGAPTRMTSVRLGNVLGSEGSVVPLFLQQIAAGGPVTVTDPHIERYFLTMDETVQRVFATAAGCPPKAAVAVPLMGEAVKIAELARYLIAQAAAQDVEIKYTGLRPGDKLREEFVAPNETVVHESADAVTWVQGSAASRSAIEAGLLKLEAAVDNRDLPSLLATMTELIPEYQPSEYLRDRIEVAVRR